MFRSLLTTRFHLQFHREVRDIQAYALIVAKTGIKMKESDTAIARPSVSVGPNSFRAVAMSTEMLANTLSRYVGHPVADDTGLKSNYDINLQWAPDMPTGSEPSSVPGKDLPTIFTAIQEQLGLKLDSRKTPMKVFIIDRLDRPEPN
jgi:uncharacterized protein (TIGR03435 family)